MRATVALTLIAVLVAACGNQQTTPAPSSALAIATASPTATPAPSVSAAPSASPSDTPLPTPTASLAALPTATPLPTPKPTPVPWKSYTSKKYHYKIQYPADWVVTPGSGTLDDQFDGYDFPYVYIYRDTVASGSIASPSLTATHEIAYIKSHYKGKLISNKPITVNGWSGRIVTMRAVDNGVNVQLVDVFIAKGRVGYGLQIWGHVERAAPDLALFKRMYSTWHAT